MKYKILAVLGMVFVTMFGVSTSGQAQQWYKGGFHMHSFWSDGNVFPEYMADLHRDMGYNFIVPSDHSRLQTDTNRWKEIASDNPQVKTYLEKYGHWVEQKDENGKHYVRLKTIHELKSKLDDPGKFLLIPGFEMATDLGKGPLSKTVHCNAINVAETMANPKGNTTSECIRIWQKSVYDSAAQHHLNSMFMLNHPFWVHYDVVPGDLINVPELQFYELNTCGKEIYTSFPKAFSRDKFWDIVCAFRLIHGDQPIYCVGADDAHNHLNFRNGGCNPGLVFVVVRADKLEPNSIIAGMKKGDFYTSSGVKMEDIRFNEKTRTLTVKVKQEEGVKYKIDFIGTKKNFDQKTIDHLVPADAGEENYKGLYKERPTRTITEYSNDIGKVFKRMEGTEASYQMADDDLYVRALITSDKKPKWTDNHTPATETAWTQPVGWQKYVKSK